MSRTAPKPFINVNEGKTHWTADKQSILMVGRLLHSSTVVMWIHHRQNELLTTWNNIIVISWENFNELWSISINLSTMVTSTLIWVSPKEIAPAEASSFLSHLHCQWNLQSVTHTLPPSPIFWIKPTEQFYFWSPSYTTSLHLLSSHSILIYQLIFSLIWALISMVCMYVSENASEGKDYREVDFPICHSVTITTVTLRKP